MKFQVSYSIARRMESEELSTNCAGILRARLMGGAALDLGYRTTSNLMYQALPSLRGENAMQILI